MASIFEQPVSNAQAFSSIQKNMMYAEIADYVDDDVDYSLVRCFCNYLTGFDDRLPAFSYVDRIVERIVSSHKKTDTFDIPISCGMGMIITCKGNDDSRSLSIFLEEPLSKQTVRREIIEADRHNVYKVTPSTIMEVDSDEVPVFREERVASMQEYLGEYTSRKEMSR